jgi:outer membrane lipase/esterase
MNIKWLSVPVVTVAMTLGPPHALAAETDVGAALEQAGAPSILVNAGDAIRATCIQLSTAPRSGPGQEDLFNRCREMVNTVIGGPNTYGYQTLGDTFNALQQFSGEEVSTQGRFATEASNRQFGNLGARMDAIRFGARALAGGLAFNFNGVDVARAIAGTDQAQPLVGGGASSDADTGWGWFANGSIGFGDRDRTINETGFDYDSYGVTLGLDYAFGNGLTLGGAVGYSNFSADLDRVRTDGVVSPVSGGKVESDSYSLSGFFVYSLGPQYVTGIVTWGRGDFDMVRRVRIDPGPDAGGTADAEDFFIDRTFTSNTDSDQLAAQVTAGRVFGTGATTLDVYAGFDWQRIDIDSFSERERLISGAVNGDPGLALSFASQDIDSFQSIVGLTVRHAASVSTGVLVPYAGIEWRHEFDNDARSVDYRYTAALSNISFRTPTDDPDKDFFELSAGLSAQFANNLFAFVQYNYTAGINNVSANLVTVGLRGVF